MAYVIRNSSISNKRYLQVSEEDQIVSFNLVKDISVATRFEDQDKANQVLKECTENAYDQAKLVERHDSHQIDVASILDFTVLRVAKD